jgi:hypothetical protein
MMNREAREELYDPGWNAGRHNTLWNRVGKYSRDSSEDVRSHLRRTYDPKKHGTLVYWQMQNGHKHSFLTYENNWKKDDTVAGGYYFRDGVEVKTQGDYFDYVKESEDTEYKVIDTMPENDLDKFIDAGYTQSGSTIEEPLFYDPKKQRTGAWLDFVKSHKHMRTAKGLLDLKAISKLWKKEKPLDLTIKGSKQKSMRLARHLRKEHPSTKGKMKVHDPAPRSSTAPPKSWFKAMYQGIKTHSDVRNPAAIVSNIWKKLTPAKRLAISQKASKTGTFKYDLPLPQDLVTRGTGTLRMVKPFKLAEVQVNLKLSDYLAALKSGLFSKMKRNDGSTALVARCKSATKNCNIFVDKVT